MKSNDLDFEISFLEGVLKHRPDYIDALAPLAEAYTRRGFFEKGLEIDKRLAFLCKDDPIVHYNLACSYVLSGYTAKALTALKQAVRLGFTDLDHLRKDPDLKPLHDYPPFQKWLEAVSPKAKV
jgi:DNA-binding SARP family transcriptional activator